MFSRSFNKLIPALVAVCCLFSCNKKGDFINENAVGSGVHYYPVIVNNAFVDTITRKALNATDTLFSPAQEIIFEMDYFSRDLPDSLELWAGKSGGRLQKVLAIPYSGSLYSFTKFIDTVLFVYRLPAGMDTTAPWTLQPRVVTKTGLSSSEEITLRIQ